MCKFLFRPVWCQYLATPSSPSRTTLFPASRRAPAGRSPADWLKHVVQKKVVSQHVAGEVVFDLPPHRVDVVRTVLPVVELDHEVASV